MDESKEYQEMCNALPEEIVKEFEMVIGSINDAGSVAVLDNGDVGYIGTHVAGWQVHGYDCSGDDVAVTRLYTQEQLQKIIVKYSRETCNYSGWSDLEIICELFTLINMSCYISFEQLYLRELMDEEFSKRWTGEEWV